MRWTGGIVTPKSCNTDASLFVNTTVTCVPAGTEIDARSKAMFMALTFSVSGAAGCGADVASAVATDVAVASDLLWCR